MRDVSYEFVFFPEYDHTGICSLLERKAQQGWMFDRETILGMRFCRIDPVDRKFQIIYLPQDDSASEKLKELQEYCAEDGWIYVKAIRGKHIFYNDEKNAVPIETDPVAQVNNVNKCMKARMRGFRIQVATICFVIISIILNLVISSAPLILSSPILLTSYTLLLTLDLLTTKGYKTWYKEAMSAALNFGVFTPTKTKYVKLFACIQLLIVICLVISPMALAMDIAHMYP